MRRDEVWGRDYDLAIAARAHSLTAYTGENIVNQATGETFAAGKVSLIAWRAKVRYRKPQYSEFA